jgi:16S rRNA (guanine527-N7)-methyltransferase
MTADGPGDRIGVVLDDARRLGLLGPDPVERHIAHARAWAGSLEPAAFLDLGSGAGIPGLVFALEWPEVTGALLDGQVRRTGWLRAAVARLDLADRISVLEGRAEDLGHDPQLRESFPLVLARGFAPPAATAECGSAFVEVEGTLSVSEPPTSDGLRWPDADLDRIGLEISGQVVQSGGTFVILRKHAPLEDGFPRRRNLPLRSPLWR